MRYTAAMATITQTVCDSCGSATDVRAIDWEIDRDANRTDLCATCLGKVLRIVMPPTQDAPTPPPVVTTDVKVPTKPVKAPTNAVGTQTVIRAWAKKKGLQVPDKGRVPTEVIQAYQAEINTAPSLESLV